jgi:hypothetical protein
MQLGGLDYHPLVEYAKRQLSSGVPLPRDMDADAIDSFVGDGDDLNSLASDEDEDEGGGTSRRRRGRHTGNIPKVGGMTSISVVGTMVAPSLSEFEELSVVDAGKLARLEAEMRAKQEEVGT